MSETVMLEGDGTGVDGFGMCHACQAYCGEDSYLEELLEIAGSAVLCRRCAARAIDLLHREHQELVEDVFQRVYEEYAQECREGVARRLVSGFAMPEGQGQA